MTHKPVHTSSLLAGWNDLEEELTAWAEAGRMADFWWRDDDAATNTAALRRLLDLAEGTPLALAAIPAEADAKLVSVLAPYSEIRILQHGWSHANHAPPEEKKCELGLHRPMEAVLMELSAGYARLMALFRTKFLPVLTPPWNRIDRSLLPLLPTVGFTGLSTDKARPAAEPYPGLLQVNVHADLVDWRGGTGFVGEGRALALIVGHLEARRLGRADAEEPTGILTHHLVQDRATHDFLARLVPLIQKHAAARWLDLSRVFPRS